MRNTKKLTTEEFILKSKEVHGDKYDYSLVSYINNYTKVKIIHNNIIYEQNPNNHLRGFKCENIKCLTQEEFILKSKEIHGDKYDYSLVEFKNVRGKIKLIYDGIVYEQFAYANLAGNSPENAPFKITTEKFIERSKEIHGDKYDYSQTKYYTNKDKVKIIYKNKIYYQSAIDHVRGNCPIGTGDSDSKGVKKIKEILEDNKIEYLTEYKFKDCKNINYLRFDFYLPKFNLLIEFDGRQHFESVSYFGGDEGFKKTKKRDKIKNNYCKRNKIPLLRISYLEFDNIEEIISNFTHHI